MRRPIDQRYEVHRFFANLVTISHGDKEVGTGYDVCGEIRFTGQWIQGIGLYQILEYIPSIARITLEIQRVEIIDDGKKRPMDDALTITSLGNAWTCTGCYLDSGSFRLTKRGCKGSATLFHALDYRITPAPSAYITKYFAGQHFVPPGMYS